MRPPQGFEPAAAVVGVDEVAKVGGRLYMAVVVIALDLCFLDRAVHPFDLAVGPGVLHLGEAMFDPVLVADAVEDVLEGVFVVSSARCSISDSQRDCK